MGLKLNIPAKLAACFQILRKGQRENGLNLSVGKMDQNATAQNRKIKK